MALFRRTKNRTPVDLDDRAPQTGLKIKDLLVLQQLIGAGADITPPRHVLHYLYFGNREAATAAAVDARAKAFECEVHELIPEQLEQWSLVCERHDVVLDPDTVRGNGDFFDALVARHGGDYDGWEASV